MAQPRSADIVAAIRYYDRPDGAGATADEALAAARLAASFVLAGKSSMGPDHGRRNPSVLLARAVADLDRLLSAGAGLPRAWREAR